MIDPRVEETVAAYRGNPQALQQKYAVSQQLIDLLALQKIKSEMDAKDREIKLRMAQTGKKPPIAQQLQQEVVGRTKQEIQQQLAGTMQQEAMEKQKALQQAVQAQEQGVAGLPAPGLMPTKAMAAGGILDFPESAEYEQDETEAGMAAGGIVAFVKGGNKGIEDEEAAKRKRLIDRLFPAVIQAESRGRRFDAEGNVLRSKKGAEGAAQVMPKTSRDPGFGVRPARDNSHEEKERVGKEYLDAMLRKYKDVDLALAAYNWGPGNVNKWLAAGGDRNKLPAETRAYIPRVKTFMAQQEKGVGEKLAEGITSLFPSAYAGERNGLQQLPPLDTGRGVKLKAAAPVEEEAYYDPMTGLKITGPEPKEYKPKPRAEARLPSGTEYDPITEGIRSGIDKATGAVREFFQGKPTAEALMPRPYPEQGVANDQRKSMPYPEGRIGRELDPTAGQPVTDEAVRAMAAPPAPPAPEAPPVPAPAPAPGGIASIIPREYKTLAEQQNKVLGQRLGVDPEEMARQRGIEYYQKVGVPTEQDLAKRMERQAGLEALDAEQLRRERENETIEALLGARGSSWQQALGSAGSAGLAAERRNMAEQRKRLMEANTAKDALATIGLDVKKSTYGAQTGARKEYEGQQEKALTEAGLALGRGMSAETARLTNEATIRSNEMLRDAQLAATKVQNEGLRQVRLEAARAQTLRAVITPLQTALAKMQSDYNTLSGGKLTPQQLADIKALEKTIELKTMEISDRFEKLMLGGDGMDVSGFKVERVK